MFEGCVRRAFLLLIVPVPPKELQFQNLLDLALVQLTKWRRQNLKLLRSNLSRRPSPMGMSLEDRTYFHDSI
jgi:hypothetical protein